MMRRLMFVTLCAVIASACGRSALPQASARSGGGSTPAPVEIDRTCDLAAYPSDAWAQCEAQNYAHVTEAPAEQAANPDFQTRWHTQGQLNLLEWAARAQADTSWVGYPSGNTPQTPLCTTWGLQCAGDPFRYADVDGPDGKVFYETEAEVVPFVIYDEGCARLSGRVWSPRGVKAGANLPNVVIENGSVQAPEPLYWWAAQMLVRAGYVVLTFDPRGQGRSDQQTPAGDQGSNANSTVFWTGLVNVIDFFRSSPVAPYPHNLSCAGTYPTEVTAFNPFFDRMDPERLGIVGHSLGATGVSVVQGYGAPGADPWPGILDAQNPVKVAVAWDSLKAPDGSSPVFGARVPSMNQSSEYGLTPMPFSQPPDAHAHLKAFDAWVAAGVPVFSITVRGSSHYEWSLLPTFPATSWCPDTSTGACAGGWGNPMAQHYTLAWLDRWLKNPNEPGYKDADARLLDDDGAQGRNKMSFRFTSARDFPDRKNKRRACADIRAGCG